MPDRNQNGIHPIKSKPKINHERQTMSTKKKKGKPKITKGKAEQTYVREQLKKTGISQSKLAEIAEVNQSNISKFLAGKTSLSDMAIEALYTAGIVKRPEPHDLTKDDQDAPPMENYGGISITTAEAAEEKGVSQATIRRWCKSGKLNYTRAGRKIMVAWDEKYKTVEPTELGKLRARVRELEETIADQNVHIQHLERKVTSNWSSALTKPTATRWLTMTIPMVNKTPQPVNKATPMVNKTHQQMNKTQSKPRGKP